MKRNKKLFKHGGSLAMVVPAEFTKHLTSDEVTFELVKDESSIPKLVLSPKEEEDRMEDDPNFALFINAIYQNALAHPEKLLDDKDVWPDYLDELLEGVEEDDADK